MSKACSCAYAAVPPACLQLVAPPGQHVSGTVELLTLSPCRQLTCLEVLTSTRLYVPFTLKTVSLATLAWPNLAALRLSLAGRASSGCWHSARGLVLPHRAMLACVHTYDCRSCSVHGSSVAW